MKNYFLQFLTASLCSHPNGKVAISAVLFDEGLYTYIIQDDSEESKIQAIFQPDGHACIYFPDGRPR